MQLPSWIYTTWPSQQVVRTCYLILASPRWASVSSFGVHSDRSGGSPKPTGKPPRLLTPEQNPTLAYQKYTDWLQTTHEQLLVPAHGLLSAMSSPLILPWRGFGVGAAGSGCSFPLRESFSPLRGKKHSFFQKSQLLTGRSGLDFYLCPKTLKVIC